MGWDTVIDALRDAGSIAAALAAIVGCVVLVVKLPPTRWVIQHLITDPFAVWFRSQVREELERTNGGSSLMDRVTKVENRLDEALGD